MAKCTRQRTNILVSVLHFKLVTSQVFVSPLVLSTYMYLFWSIFFIFTKVYM